MDLPKLIALDKFAYDTETTGLVYPIDRAFGISISTPDGKDYYWDIRRQPKVIDWLNDQMLLFRGRVICHNAKFDYMMSHNAGIKLPINQLDDTATRAVLINEHLNSYDLDSLSKKYTNKEKLTGVYEELAGIFGGAATKKVQMRNISDAPVEVVAPYAKADTRATLELWNWQEEEIERQGIHDIVEFERGLMPTFIRANMRGVRVDLDAAEQAMAKITPQIEEAQAKLSQAAGWDINVNSASQIKKMFNPKQGPDGEWYVGEERIGKTASGAPSLKAEFLREMSDPRAMLIVDIRSMLKTRDTFLGKHILEHAHGDRVYPNINQNKGEDGGTGTGRLSYTDPALQQIPSRNKLVAAIVKACFLPEEGHDWVDADQSSFEVRSFAHLINDQALIQAYRADPETDMHQYVADLTGLVRNATYSGEPNSKQLNLSMIFNSGNGAIADKMGLPWEWESFLPRGKADKPENYVWYKKAGPEAMAVINKYHRTLPGVKRLAEKAKRVAEDRGFLFTSTGRRLRFPRGYKSYKASGLLIQATAADENKRCWKVIEETMEYGHLILNTHDSYSMSIEKGKCEQQARAVKSAIENSSSWRVPLVLEVNHPGANWWESTSSERWM